MSYQIGFSTFLFAPPDEVMELLTNPVFIEEWSEAKSSFEKKVGGKFEMFGGWVSGEVLKIDEKELAYTWKTTDWDESTPASKVYFRLEPVEHGTEVYVDHVELPSQKEADDHKNGWKEYFFNPIGEYLSNRKF